MTLLLKNFIMLKAAERQRKKNNFRKGLLLLRIKMVRERNYVTRECLHLPCDAPWAKLYAEGSDKNFINVTALDRRSFKMLLAIFAFKNYFQNE